MHAYLILVDYDCVSPSAPTTHPPQKATHSTEGNLCRTMPLAKRSDQAKRKQVKTTFPFGGIMSDTTNPQAQHKHTNRLINETSPYLLQHAHNPVDWYSWGEEAMHKAKVEDKPILLSVGYSACHCCHVMERESFDNEEIAAIMNQHFISIKVDRDERPDIDNIYMQAVHALTPQG